MAQRQLSAKLKSSKKALKKKVKNNSSSSQGKNQKKNFEGQWPNAHNVLFRPDRYNYVKKTVQPKGCVFCSAVKANMSLESLCIYKTQFSMIVLNKFPYNSGHLLILPLKHCGSLLDLSDSEYDDLHRTLKLAVKAISTVYEPIGMNIGMNHGLSSGAGIPEHLHYHVIPRWAGDLNFFPLIAQTKVVIESLEQSYGKYIQYFRSL